MKKLVTILVSILFVFAVVGMAKDSGVKVSVNAGYHVESSDLNADGGVVFGGNIGLTLSKGLELTGGVSLSSFEDDTGLYDVTETHFLVGMYYAFGKGKVTPKIGAGLDLGVLDASILWIEDSDSGIGFWAAAGLDFPMGKKSTAGIEARFVTVSLDGGNFGGIQLLAVFAFGL